jgi:ubiquitin C-terminal hydrolase
LNRKTTGTISQVLKIFGAISVPFPWWEKSPSVLLKRVAGNPEYPLWFQKGQLPYSYQLTSVVCHLGSSSSAGHYVSDVYDIRKHTWFSYDDSHVEKTSEKEVRASRKKSGYIFFYMNK